MSTKPIYQSLNPEDSHEDSFAPLIERFTTYLKARSHKNTTLSLYLASARHFLCWLTQRPFDSREIDPKWVREFIEVHLPGCHCPSPAPKSLKTTRAALNQLLLMQGHDMTGSTRQTSQHPPRSRRHYDSSLPICGMCADLLRRHADTVAAMSAASWTTYLVTTPWHSNVLMRRVSSALLPANRVIISPQRSEHWPVRYVAICGFSSLPG